MPEIEQDRFARSFALKLSSPMKAHVVCDYESIGFPTELGFDYVELSQVCITDKISLVWASYSQQTFWNVLVPSPKLRGAHTHVIFMPDPIQ